MSQVAQELQAVLGRRKPAQNVAPRDFGQPRRLSPARASALRIALENALPALEKKLGESAGLPVGLRLALIGEVDAETLPANVGEPPCVLRFRCQKAPGWLLWDAAAAAGAVEAVFGAQGGARAARRLSPTEVRIAGQLLSELVRAVSAVAGVTPADFAFVQVLSELGTWREAGPEAESHRVELRIELELGGQTSTLRLFLPGVDCGSAESAPLLPAALPGHLERVEVELSACLAGCEISLDQLLALEEGDVIPLEARLGDPTTLSVEGLTLAQARLGSHRGRLAVRIERLNVQPEPTA